MVRRATELTGAIGFTTGVKALGGIALARALGPEDKGRVALVLAVGSLWGLVGTFGVHTAIRVVLPSSENREATRGVYRELVLYLVAGGTLLSVIPLAVLVQISAITTPGEVALAGLYLVGMQLILLLKGDEQARGALRRAETVLLLVATVHLAGYVLLWLSGIERVQPYILVLVLGVGVGVFALRGPRAAQRGSGSVTKGRIIREGMKAHVGGTTMAGVYRVDRLLLGYLAGPAAVGYYSIAVAISELVLLCANGLSQYLLYNEAEGGGRVPDRLEGRLSLGGLGVLVAFLGAGALAVPIWLAAPKLVPWVYGEAFLPALEPLAILLGAACVAALWRTGASVLAGRGELGLYAKAGIVGLTVNVALGIILIQELGTVGAAWASLVSYSVVAAFAVTTLLSKAEGRRGRKKTDVDRG